MGQGGSRHAAALASGRRIRDPKLEAVSLGTVRTDSADLRPCLRDATIRWRHNNAGKGRQIRRT